MLNRIKEAFKEKAKVAYLTAGDGGELSPEYFISLAEGGVNLLEIGIPFSDPVADGTVIQLAMERAIKNGTNLAKVLEIIKKVRQETDVAIILFTYFNQIHHNLDTFLQDASNAGVDGILVVDLPYEESEELMTLAMRYNISVIFVATPSTSNDRIKLLSSKTNGFLYYACRNGTTGVRDGISTKIENQIKQVCKHSKLPVAVGFGISNSQTVDRILSIADGCVVGSYFVKAVGDNVDPSKLQEMASNIFSGSK